MIYDKDFLKHKDAWRNPDIYQEVYDFSIQNPEEYWRAQIDRLDWQKEPTIVYSGGNGGSGWFVDGKINACYNCVDRHAKATPDKTAIIWQGEDLDEFEYISFKSLKDEVSRFANTIKHLGVTRNDYVTIYMPMIPEGIYACLACARLGIPYSAVFAGFSPNALALRMDDCRSNFVITADASKRGGKISPLKENLDEAIRICKRDIKALVVRRQGIDIKWHDDLDFDYYSIAAQMSLDCPIEETDSLSELFILYTSGSVGKPKGVLHGTGGFLLFSAITHRYFFDIEDDTVFWCSGDIGWMGGHAYSLYAPLCNGITTLIFEGMPTYPRSSVFWEIVDRHQVSSFNTAPTAIRAMMKNSDESLANTSRQSLRLLGVFGEVLNKEAWSWYFKEVGGGRCPLVNMWGQTELGGVVTSPLCNIDEMKSYGHIGRPFFGCEIAIKDCGDRDVFGPNITGSMFLKKSMPGMMIGIFGDQMAMDRMYYSQSKDEGTYCTGDEAYFDDAGNTWITGRMDDVLNVSGHRISPIEIEDVISECDIVAEVSVVGFPHDIKGEGICAFVVLKTGISNDEIDGAKDLISKRVRDTISPITRPDIVRIVDDLPKTRSGKIMRRILRKIASNDVNDFSDVTTISNPECIQRIMGLL